MIIICPACTARFVVKAEAIGENGRKVKCAKCAHSWFQAPNTEALEAAKAAQPEPAAVEPIPEGSNVPVVQKTRKPIVIKVAVAASVLVVLVLGSVLLANHILPAMGGYYSLFGIYDAKDIALYDVNVERVEEGQYQDLVVSGKIVNESKEEKHLPDLRLVIMDEEGNAIKTITLDAEDGMIAPGAAVDFSNRVPQLPKAAAKVVMDLGNKLDLAAR